LAMKTWKRMAVRDATGVLNSKVTEAVYKHKGARLVITLQWQWKPKEGQGEAWFVESMGLKKSLSSRELLKAAQTGEPLLWDGKREPLVNWDEETSQTKEKIRAVRRREELSKALQKPARTQNGEALEI
jgi:hypothetical protein